MTDVIAFPFSEDPGRVSGDIFISIERVLENAIKYNTAFEEELKRVMIHGVLHLIGYKDKKLMEKKEMKDKEDYYLAKLAIM